MSACISLLRRPLCRLQLYINVGPRREIRWAGYWSSVRVQPVCSLEDRLSRPHRSLFLIHVLRTWYLWHIFKRRRSRDRACKQRARTRVHDQTDRKIHPCLEVQLHGFLRAIYPSWMHLELCLLRLNLARLSALHRRSNDCNSDLRDNRDGVHLDRRLLLLQLHEFPYCQGWKESFTID